MSGILREIYDAELGPSTGSVHPAASASPDEAVAYHAAEPEVMRLKPADTRGDSVIPGASASLAGERGPAWSSLCVAVVAATGCLTGAASAPLAYGEPHVGGVRRPPGRAPRGRYLARSPRTAASATGTSGRWRSRSRRGRPPRGPGGSGRHHPRRPAVAASWLPSAARVEAVDEREARSGRARPRCGVSAR